MKYYRTKLSEYLKVITETVTHSNDNCNTGTRTVWTMKYSLYPIRTFMNSEQGILIPYRDTYGHRTWYFATLSGHKNILNK